MSTRQRTIVILLVIGLILTALVVYFYFFAPKPIDWRETYDSTSDQPFGTSMVLALVKDAVGPSNFLLLEEPLDQALNKELPTPSTYFFIGRGRLMDSLQVDALLEFVGRGNTAFMSSRHVHPRIREVVLPDGACDSNLLAGSTSHRARRASLQLPGRTDASFSYHFRKRSDTLFYLWVYHYPTHACNGMEDRSVWGTLDTFAVNYLRVPHGKGQLILHTTPLAFTNLALDEEAHFEYARQALAFLPKGPVLWDRQGEKARPARPLSQSYSAESPLQYVLSQPPLAWAWYLMLALGLLYVLFQAKRRQRLVPVLEKNENTSLEYVSTIGRLYFLQQNHGQLCRQKMRLFHSYVNRRYGIRARSLEHPEGWQQLAQTAEVDPQKIRQLATMSRNIRHATTVSEHTLETYHRLLDYFYKNCK